MKHVFRTIGICCAGALLASCGNSGYSSSSETSTPVYLTEVGVRTIEEFITTTGTAKAAKSIDLSSETEGAGRQSGESRMASALLRKRYYIKRTWG